MTAPTPPGEKLTSQPSARTFRVEELVKLVHAGQVRVPEFQRGLRWGINDVEALFDSLLRGFPVGNLLLWQKRRNPAQEVRLGELTVAAPESDSALWVVDGQQRVTSLANAVSREAFEASSRFALVYDVEKRRIVRRDRGTERLSVPLPVIFDLRQLLAWVPRHPELSDHIELLNDVAGALRDVLIPASIVADADDSVLREIFDRTNNAGKRLSRAEVFSALFGQEVDGPHHLSLTRLAESVEAQTRFGAIDRDTVLHAVLACGGPDISRDIRPEFTPARMEKAEFPDDEQQAYRRAREAMVAAVTFLRDTAGVPHFTFLPYRYVLVTLTRFFAHHPHPHTRNLTLLVRWVWQAGLRGPGVFQGSATGATRTLCSRITPGEESASVQGLLSAVADDHPPPMPDLTRFRTNEAAARMVLCALWTLAPRSLDSGDVLTTDDLAVELEGKATAFDVAFNVVPRHRPSGARSASGRIIAAPDDAETARGLLRGQSSVSDEKLVDDIFASHAINAAARQALARGDDLGFLIARAATLEELLASVTLTRTGHGLEATPPLDSLDLDDGDIDARDDDALF